MIRDFKYLLFIFLQILHLIYPLQENLFPQQEDISILTAYPSPYGYYDQIKVDPQGTSTNGPLAQVGEGTPPQSSISLYSINGGPSITNSADGRGIYSELNVSNTDGDTTGKWAGYFEAWGTDKCNGINIYSDNGYLAYLSGGSNSKGVFIENDFHLGRVNTDSNIKPMLYGYVSNTSNARTAFSAGAQNPIPIEAGVETRNPGAYFKATGKAKGLSINSTLNYTALFEGSNLLRVAKAGDSFTGFSFKSDNANLAIDSDNNKLFVEHDSWTTGIPDDTKGGRLTISQNDVQNNVGISIDCNNSNNMRGLLIYNTAVGIQTTGSGMGAYITKTSTGGGALHGVDTEGQRNPGIKVEVSNLFYITGEALIYAKHTLDTGIALFGKNTNSATPAIGVGARIYSGKAIHGKSQNGYAGYFNGKLKYIDPGGGYPTKHIYDIAELIEVAGDVKDGDVVTYDENLKIARKCDKKADTKIIGIISENPKLALGDINKDREEGHNYKYLALKGQVYVNVDAFYSPIQKGDLLMSSPTPGYAIKAEPLKNINGYDIYPPGVIIGKALENLETGKGKILVLICLG